MNNEKQLQHMAEVINAQRYAEAQQIDPRRAQLMALFDMSDERGKELLVAIAGIHAARYPKVKA